MAVKIGLHVDEFATMDSSPEEEYAEIEEAIREAVPGVDITFVRDLPPHKLSQTSVSVYVFDIGGMCRVDWNGERREELSRQVNKLADDRPNTLFVPWSSMTRNYLRSAIRMLQPQWEDGDTPTAEIPLGDRPNVSLPHESQEEKLFQYGPQEHYTAAIKRWIMLDQPADLLPAEQEVKTNE